MVIFRGRKEKKILMEKWHELKLCETYNCKNNNMFGHNEEKLN